MLAICHTVTWKAVVVMTFGGWGLIFQSVKDSSQSFTFATMTDVQ